MQIFTDVMIDTETTGLDPSNAGLMQIGAVKFNYVTEEIGPVFNRCMAMAPNRFWDEDTRTWWMGQNRKVFNGIISRMEDPQTVLRDFSTYILDGSRELETPIRMWAKPVHFDFPIVASHFRQFGMMMPINFRYTRDLNTFMAARAGGVEHQEMAHIQIGDMAHDALADSVHQLKLLFAAKRGDFGPTDVEYTEFTDVAA